MLKRCSGEVDVVEKRTRESPCVCLYGCGWAVQRTHTNRRPNCLAACVRAIRTQRVLSYAFRPASQRSLTITVNADFWPKLKNNGILSRQEVAVALSIVQR